MNLWSETLKVTLLNWMDNFLLWFSVCFTLLSISDSFCGTVVIIEVFLLLFVIFLNYYSLFCRLWDQFLLQLFDVRHHVETPRQVLSLVLKQKMLAFQRSSLILVCRGGLPVQQVACGPGTAILKLYLAQTKLPEPHADMSEKNAKMCNEYQDSFYTFSAILSKAWLWGGVGRADWMSGWPVHWTCRPVCRTGQ